MVKERLGIRGKVAEMSTRGKDQVRRCFHLIGVSAIVIRKKGSLEIDGIGGRRRERVAPTKA